jgi:hypothetical protein
MIYEVLAIREDSPDYRASDVAVSIGSIWDRYLKRLIDLSSDERHMRWCIRRVEQLVKAYPGICIDHLQPEHVESWLSRFAQDQRILDWQVAQAAVALEIFFCDVQKAPWAKSFDWQLWRVGSERIGPGHATLRRAMETLPTRGAQAAPPESSTTLAEIEAKYPQLLDKLKATCEVATTPSEPSART